jgi:ATP-dependent protease ClpP protease subunit
VISATKSPVELLPRTAPAALVEYFGTVNYATNERVLNEIKRRLPGPATLMVTSAGGPSGTAMSFYDAIRFVLKAELTAVGSGDVDSSGMIVFLSGRRRLVTPHTTALLHPAGRTFDAGVRYSALELAAMLSEDRLKDELYASIVAANSSGRLTPAGVLELMRAHTVLKAEDFIKYGLAGAVLQ